MANTPLVRRKRRLAHRRRSRLQFELLECRCVLAGGEINLGAQTDLFDQPYVSIELRSGDTVIGPTGNAFEIYPYNRLLLDTGANGIIAVSDAVTDMEQNGYQIEGEYEEIGVSGAQLFDVSAAYEFRFKGSDEITHTLPQTADEVRILSNPTMKFGIAPSEGGIPGIVGMPAMVGRVTTLDMSGWDEVTDLFDLTPLGVSFSGAVPAGDGHRYSVATDTRILFDVRDGLPVGSPPDAPLPTWAPIPFLDVSPRHLGRSVTGGFLLDTGAQISMLSSQLAFDLGLDENGNGDLLDEAVDSLPIIGVGGVVEIPLMLIDEISLMTEQGTLITFGGGPDDYIVLAVHDVAPGIEGIFGADLLTSGLSIDPETLGVSGSPYFQQIHMDFRTLATEGLGRLHFDVSPQYDIESPINAAPLLTVGEGVSYTENQAAVLLAAAATLVDVDSPILEDGTLTIAITVGATLADRLVIVPGEGITLAGGIVSFDGQAIGTASGGAGSTPLTVALNGHATPEAVEKLVQRIGFRNGSDRPSTLQRSVRFEVSDGDGGVSEPATVTVDVIALNDAPQLDQAATPTLTAILEGTEDPRGTLVRSLLSGAYTDADGALLRGIAVTGASGSTQGNWEFTLDGGVTWQALGAVSSTSAVLLPADASTRVRFIPRSLWNGEVRLYYRAWDQTQGVAGQTLNVTVPGTVGRQGTLSVAADYAPLTVTPVNNAPVLTGSQTVDYRLNSLTGAALASTFSLSDVDDRTFGGGQLRVRIASGAEAANRLFIAGGFGRSGNDVLWDGKVIGTINVGGGIGGTALVVSLTDNATVGLVQLLMRSIRFRTENSSLTVDRWVDFRVYDGELWSGVARSTVRISA